MRRLLILLCALACFGFALTAPTAASAGQTQHHGKVASCIVRAEYDQLNAGMTRSHVEDDIFDGYDGSQTDFIHAAGYDVVWRHYAHCADGTAHAALRFRRLDGETLWKLWSGTYFGCWTDSTQFGCSGP
jgi:hypothetical protein